MKRLFVEYKYHFLEINHIFTSLDIEFLKNYWMFH